MSDEEIDAVTVAESSCTSYQIPTYYTLAQDGKGVYFLEPTQEQHDDMNRRPVARNKQEELDIFKCYNATYYENLSLAPGGEQLEGPLVHDDY